MISRRHPILCLFGEKRTMSAADFVDKTRVKQVPTLYRNRTIPFVFDANQGHLQGHFGIIIMSSAATNR